MRSILESAVKLGRLVGASASPSGGTFRVVHYRRTMKKMPTYKDMVELAKICVRQARASCNPEVAQELRRLAREYQTKAADLDGGKLPDIGQD